jgi:hypothetical protein
MADSTGATAAAKPATSAPAEKVPASAQKAIKADAEQAAAAAKDRLQATKDLADRDYEDEKVRVEGEYAAHEDAEKRAKSGDLGPAGESTDPDVHQALAELEIAKQNRDIGAEAVAERKLNLLGVSAK